MATYNKVELTNLRNIALALHASAGFLITIPTDAAINGMADQDQIRLRMMDRMIEIQMDLVHLSQALNTSDHVISGTEDQLLLLKNYADSLR